MASAGDTGVVVLVPEAEAVVSPWRQRHDRSAAQGMPAHITLLYPFLPERRLDDATLGRLAAICAGVDPFEVTLARTDRFPETIFLAPEPAEPFRTVTGAIAAAWPEAPPYGGQFESVTPHLTIADGVDDAVMDGIDRAVTDRLPLHARLAAADLFVFNGARWEPRLRLPFGPATPA